MAGYKRGVSEPAPDIAAWTLACDRGTAELQPWMAGTRTQTSEGTRAVPFLTRPRAVLGGSLTDPGDAQKNHGFPEPAKRAQPGDDSRRSSGRR